MPIPIILGVAAAVAGITGVGSGIHGVSKIKEANDTMKYAESRHKRNQEKFRKQNEKTTRDMDKVGSLELNILHSFKLFSDLIEKIQNRPYFDKYQINGVELPKYDERELDKVSVGAGVLLGGIGGAAAGTAGGFAAAGATTAAVTALGAASTGTAIASLSGAAATNATMAALGGGAVAAGGGGIALGTAVLGAATLGVGLLVGGLIFNHTGSSLSEKADEAWRQMKRAEREINRACDFMQELSETALKYANSLDTVNTVYQDHLTKLKDIVDFQNKTDWNDFTYKEKRCVENTALLVGLLYNMCKVKLVLKTQTESELNTINTAEVDKSMSDASQVLSSHDFALN